MCKPTEYFRIVTGTFIRFDPEDKPWPEGVIVGASVTWRDNTSIGIRVDREGFYLGNDNDKLWRIYPGDSLELDDTGKTIAVIPADEFESMGWSDKNVSYLQGRMKDAKEILRRMLNLQVISPELRHDVAEFLAVRHLYTLTTEVCDE